MDPAISAKQSALVQRLVNPPRAEVEEAMTTLDLPVLVLFATFDRVIPPEMGRIYRAKLPRCHLVYVYDAGHAIDIDRPEAVASVVGEFLERGEGFIVNRQSGLINP
jgi:pimeloyl-ACP methyl ester carboxylesterase